MAGVQGGPIPYELRIAPDGRVWMSELQGNRIVSFDPANGAFKTYDLPTPVSAPRRFDIDEQGVLWIPAYAANALVRFDPRSERFSEYALPVKDAVPYVARVDAERGLIWIGTNASDEVYAFDPRSGRFTVYPLPSARRDRASHRDRSKKRRRVARLRRVAGHSRAHCAAETVTLRELGHWWSPNHVARCGGSLPNKCCTK